MVHPGPSKRRNPPRAKKTKKSAKRNRRGGAGKIAAVLMLLGTVTMAVVSLPIFIIIIAGMVPTAVAYVVDREPEKYAAIAVGAFNIVGILPFILDLWYGPATVNVAVDLLIDPFTWLVMYGAASFGWVLYLGLPSFASVWLEASSESQIGRLSKEQAKLIEDWGDGVDTRAAVGPDL